MSVADEAQRAAWRLRRNLRNCRYRHYRTGEVYRISDFEVDADTLDVRVSYVNVRTGKRWSRPFGKFFDLAEESGTGVFRRRIKPVVRFSLV